MTFEHIESRETSTKGPPEFNLLAASAAVADMDVDRHVRRGHRLRAEAMQRFGTSVGRSARVLSRRLAQGLRRWREVRETERVLRSLSPQMLRDIGIEGYQIPAVARGIGVNRNAEPRAGALVQRLHAEAPPLEDCCLDEAA